MVKNGVFMVQDKSKHVPVFFATDENYAKPLTVSMYSVLANTSRHIDFYVLSNKLKSKTKKKMQKSLERFDNFTITFIPMEKQDLTGCPDLLWYTKCAYYRYFIPELCLNIKKCVYMDVDMILKSDIGDLFDMELNGFSLGAVAGNRNIIDKQEYFNDHLDNLGIKKTHNYFGSGILLIDSEKWRQLRMTNKLLQTTKDIWYLLKFADQDVLNVVFDGNKFKDIGVVWGGLQESFADEVKNNQDVIDKFKLVHFCGKMKPWNQKCSFDNFFWMYAKKTLFYPKPCLLNLWWMRIRCLLCLPWHRSKYKTEYEQKKTTRAAYCAQY